jgi:hypothetical protein
VTLGFGGVKSGLDEWNIREYSIEETMEYEDLYG